MRLLALAAAICLSSCSINGEAADPRPVYVDAAASAFSSGNSGPALPEDVSECVGAALVDVVGAEVLRDAGVSAQELADADDLVSLDVEVPNDAIERLGQSLSGCDLGAAIEEPLLEAFAAESGGPLTDGAASCVLEAADDRDIEAGMAATFVDRSTGTAGFDELLDAVASCPTAVAELLVNGFGQTRGAPLPPEVARCVHDHVAADPEAAGETFTEGGAAADAYAASLLAACPDITTPPDL